MFENYDVIFPIMWGTFGVKYKEKEQHGKGQGSQSQFLSVV